MMMERSLDELHEWMVTRQIEQRGIRTPKVLSAFRAVPRHLFVPEELQQAAYEDTPLPIGFSQTISQPYMVALMTDLLCLRGDETVLEIGTGSGYQAAILCKLSAWVHTIERIPQLAQQALVNLMKIEIENVTVHVGDGTEGWPQGAPYRAVIVTAGAPRPPAPLLDQVAEGGRLVIPVGQPGDQVLEVWHRISGGWTHEAVVPVLFVPLIGKHGWPDR